jgi:hypothetical protein
MQLALVLTGFLILAWPLLELTHGQRPASAPAPAVSSAETGTLAYLRLRWAHLPAQLIIRQQERVLFQLQPDALSPTEQSLNLRLSERSAELSVTARWPAGTPETALSLELEPEGMDAQTQTHWTSSSSQDMEQLFVFNWSTL